MGHHGQNIKTYPSFLGIILAFWLLHRMSKPPQRPIGVSNTLVKVNNMSEYSNICLLAHPNPSSHSLSLFSTLHRYKHQIHHYILYLDLQYSTYYYQWTPQSPFPHHHHLLLLLLLLFLIKNSLYLSLCKINDVLHCWPSPLFNHGSKPECKIDHFPLPVVDSNLIYKYIVGLWSLILPPHVNGQSLRGWGWQWPRGWARAVPVNFNPTCKSLNIQYLHVQSTPNIFKKSVVRDMFKMRVWQGF